MRTLLGSFALVSLSIAATAQTHLGEQRVIMLCCYTGPTPPNGAAELLDEFEDMMSDAADWNAENSRDCSVNPPVPLTTWNWSVYGWYPITAKSAPWLEAWEAVQDAIEDGKVIEPGDRIVLVRSLAPSECPEPPNECEDQGAFQVPIDIDPHPSQMFLVPLFWLYGNFTSSADIDIPDILRAVKHESAHTYPLNHARMTSSIDGVIYAYNNVNDVMGGEPSLSRHVQAAYKEFLGWIDPATTISPGMSGVHTIGPLEIPRGSIDGVDAPRALRIATGDRVLLPGISTGATVYYYIENRTKASSVIVDPPVGEVQLEFDTTLGYNSADGALVNRVAVDDSPTSSPHSFGVDVTPETPFHTSADGTVTEGRSFFDPAAGVCITNLGKVGENLQVEVNFVADFPANRPPVATVANVTVQHDPIDPKIVTFTVDATDPDDDALSYFWNFMVDWYSPGAAYQQQIWTGLPNYGSGSPVTYTFPTTASRRVWLKVSDRKGGETDWIAVPLWGWQQQIVSVSPGGTTIQAAIDSVAAGGAVELASGTYTGVGNRDLRFTNQKRITVRAAPGATPVIDCQDLGRGFVFDLQESIHCIVEGITIRNGRKITGSGYDSKGGGMLIRAAARPIVRNCVFDSNEATQGGAIYFERVVRPRIESCVFTGNTATSAGGAVYASIALDAWVNQNANGSPGGFVTLARNRFVGNFAAQGGALWFDDATGHASREREPAGIELRENEIVANSAGVSGWAVYCNRLRGRALLSNNTIARNACATGGGGWTIADLDGDAIDSPTTVYNTILWENTPADLGIAPTHAWVQSGQFRLRHCLKTAAWTAPPPNVGNVTGNPRFVAPDAPTYDFALSPFQSPCVDAAEWVPRSPTDRAGNPRFDDPQRTNTGLGAITYVDIGANERQAPSYAYWTGTQGLVRNSRQSTQGGNTSYLCTSQTIFVGADIDTVTMKNRAFLDFVLPGSVAGDVQRVELEVNVFDGMTPSWAQVQTRAMTMSASEFELLGCDALWASISSSTLYTQGLGFHQDSSPVRYDLGAAAAADLENHLTPSGGWFSVGLRAASEGIDNMMELYNFTHRLHVYYVPSN